MAQLFFNAQNVAPQQSAAPIPAGVYLAHVVDSDVRPLKSGNGTGLSLTFEVLQGPYARRKVFANINVKHANPEVERIGQSQLSALCHAIGRLNINGDSAMLHMVPCMIRVKVRKDESGQYEDRNEVSGYEAAQAGGAAPGGLFPPTPGGQVAPQFQPTMQAPQQQPAAAAFGQPPAPAPQPAAAAPVAAPWARRTTTAA
ncbi:MAG: hypothetical protein RLY71_2807 [Pseudomonadota bacterium]|jgi:hypothetical protein